MDNGRKSILVFGSVIIGLTIGLNTSCNDEKERGESLVYWNEEANQYVIEHPETGLIWLRCPIGQEWSPDSIKCEGGMSVLSMNESMNSCPEGFSLPNDNDFASIICNYQGRYIGACCGYKYQSCSECSICEEMFGEDEGHYLSKDMEPYEDWGEDGWLVSIWELGMACHYYDWDNGTDYVRYNVKCVFKLPDSGSEE